MIWGNGFASPVFGQKGNNLFIGVNPDWPRQKVSVRPLQDRKGVSCGLWMSPATKKQVGYKFF